MDNHKIDLNIDVSQIKSHQDYLELWNRMGKIRITCVEKYESCKHNVGDSFVFDHPYQKPQNVCKALLHVLDLYSWRTVLGFPSWNSENRKVFKLHCPDPKGTVWEMEKTE